MCDFPIDRTSDPSQSIGAALTNLFYWTNHVLDVQYQYGFDTTPDGKRPRMAPVLKGL